MKHMAWFITHTSVTPNEFLAMDMSFLVDLSLEAGEWVKKQAGQS